MQATSACALHRDLKTTQKLFATYDSTLKQILIQPNNPTDPKDTSTLEISDVAYVFYGTGECDFGLKVEKEVSNTDKEYVVEVSQGMGKMMGDTMGNVRVNVTLLTENSVKIGISSVKQGDVTPHEIYDKSYSMYKDKATSYKLSDILVVNKEPFSLKVLNPKDKSQVLLSTEDTVMFQHELINIINVR